MHGHSLQAAALSSGKPRWAFPSSSKWIPDWIHRRDSLGLAGGTVFVGPLEVEPAGGEDGGGGSGADYDLAEDADVGSDGEGGAEEARLHTLTALSAVTAARSGRLLLRARAEARVDAGAAAAPPSPGSAPAAGSLVLVSTENPGSHLYAVAEVRSWPCTPPHAKCLPAHLPTRTQRSWVCPRRCSAAASDTHPMRPLQLPLYS